MPESKKQKSKTIKVAEKSGHSNYFALRFTSAQIEKINWFIEETGLAAADLVREGTMVMLAALEKEEQWAMAWARRLREDRGLNRSS
jgi:hypothetical protein